MSIFPLNGNCKSQIWGFCKAFNSKCMKYFYGCQAYFECIATVLIDEPDKTTTLMYFKCRGTVKMSIFTLNEYRKSKFGGFSRPLTQNVCNIFQGARHFWKAQLLYLLIHKRKQHLQCILSVWGRSKCQFSHLTDIAKVKFGVFSRTITQKVKNIFQGARQFYIAEMLCLQFNKTKRLH